MMFLVLFYIKLIIVPLAVLANADIAQNHTNEIVDLTEVSFDTNVTQAPHFVLFFEPECPSCKKLLEIWQHLANLVNRHTKGRVVIAKIDCVANEPLCIRSDINAKKHTYTRLPGVVNNEGVGIRQESNINFGKCAKMCDDEALCNSFALCDFHECNLKDKIVFQDDPYTENSYCFTAYRANGTLARIYIPKGKKMTWNEINMEAYQDSYKLPLINDLNTYNIGPGDDKSWIPVRRRDGLTDDWVSANDTLCPENSVERFCSHRDAYGIPDWSRDLTKQTTNTLSFFYAIPIMIPKLIFFKHGLHSSGVTHEGRRDFETLRDVILAQMGKVKSEYEETNDLLIDAGCKYKEWDDSKGYSYDKYTWIASGQLLAKGACVDKTYRPNFVPEEGRTKIYSTIEYYKVRSVDSRNEMMSIDFVLVMQWLDPNIKTNFSNKDVENGGILLSSRIMSKIWTPDLDIYNQTKFRIDDEWRSLKRIKVLTSQDIEKLEKWGKDEIRIHKVTMELRYEIKTTVYCNFNHKKYPMDTQTCRLRFGSRSLGAIFALHDPKEIYHIPTTYTGDRFEISSKFFDDGAYRGNNTIGIILTMRRIRQSFYVKYYIPCGAIVLVSQLGFFIPVTAIPGRVALLITLFLSLINLLIYQMGESPSSSDLNAIAIYLLTSLAFVVGALIEFAMLIFFNQNYGIFKHGLKNNKIDQGMIDVNDRMKGVVLRVRCSDRNVNDDRFEDLTKRVKNEEIGNCSGPFHTLISIFSKIDYISFGVFLFLFIIFNCIYWTFFLLE